ncbi:one-helix protein 2 [Striga hermonthica]|uniref:One-helix protein 2 n=1 Tax=Striga hermonthica TaxID=68872 RepID=A0A9N7NHZ0_STRHE|nr:one-helix protein 2 [Striga hermonthica]
MSVAKSPSFPFIKLRNSSPSPPSYSAYAPSSSSSFKFTIRSSQAEGPLRRPVAPAPLKPVLPSPTPPDSPPVASTPPKPPPAAAAAVENKSGITLEFQRQKAKELQEYFKKKKVEEADQGPFFGFIAKNEISNGRWAMFGFAVGMLTEYATGSDFVDQVKILLSNFGIVDLE